MRIRRTTENGVYVYHVAEAHPQGRVDKVMVWRTGRGYFGEITIQKKRIQSCSRSFPAGEISKAN
jgi:hypothetical protein